VSHVATYIGYIVKNFKAIDVCKENGSHSSCEVMHITLKFEYALLHYIALVFVTFLPLFFSSSFCQLYVQRYTWL